MFDEHSSNPAFCICQGYTWPRSCPERNGTVNYRVQYCISIRPIHVNYDLYSLRHPWSYVPGTSHGPGYVNHSNLIFPSMDPRPATRTTVDLETSAIPDNYVRQRSLRICLRTVFNASDCWVHSLSPVIFVFLPVFPRQLHHTLDPRVSIVLSSATFVVGCNIWEAIEYLGRDALKSTTRIGGSDSTLPTPGAAVLMSGTFRGPVVLIWAQQ